MRNVVYRMLGIEMCEGKNEAKHALAAVKWCHEPVAEDDLGLRLGVFLWKHSAFAAGEFRCNFKWPAAACAGWLEGNGQDCIRKNSDQKQGLRQA